ncbi:TPA: methionine adenosyltransferase domain-containing protein [Streptococcus suis]|nr:methionine adenosyltransferase domain-containing protein [Streptococcus suis]
MGDGGVGKSAIVDGIAMRIANSEVASLKGKRILQFSLNDLYSVLNGDYNRGILRFIEEMKREKDVILFVDEIHILGRDKALTDIVREGYAKRCEVQLAYAIGVAEPVSVHVETFGTSRYTAKQLEGMIRERYDLTPRGIIKELDLLNVDYTKTTCFGHFTKDYLPWEK